MTQGFLLCFVMAALLLLSASHAPVSSSVPLLTLDNYDELTRDKAIMIRFITQWCESCDETQADWDRLAKDWESHPIGLIAQVFCDHDEIPIKDEYDEEEDDTTTPRSAALLLCEEYEVAGYPSVYYGDPESPELYVGSLDYASLSLFAKTEISTLPCSVRNIGACDEATRKRIEEFQQYPQERLEKIEDEVLQKVKKEQSTFDAKAMDLQKQYEKMANAYNAKLDQIRGESGFKWIQQILLARQDETEATDNGNADNDAKEEL